MCEQDNCSIPYGFCHCGCGEPAPLAKYNDRRFGHRKGVPVRFINGHNCRKPRRYRVVLRVFATPCHEWQGTISTEGYGVFRENYRQIKAHRRAYEQTHGKIPFTLVIDHLCSNKRCVNPDHLRAVTSAENSRRYWREEWSKT